MSKPRVHLVLPVLGAAVLLGSGCSTTPTTPSASAPTASSSVQTPAATDSGSPSPTASAASAASAPSAAADLPSAKEVYAKVRDASLAATSATMKGSLPEGKETLVVEISGSTKGDPQRATLQLGKKSGKATVITVGGKYYLTGDDAFWSEQAGVDGAKALKNKYVVIEESAAKELGDFQIGSMLKDMFSDPELSTFESLLTPVGVGTVGDTPAWVLGASGEGQIFVASDGSDQLLKIVGPKSTPGEFTFSDWNTAAKVVAPKKEQIIAM